MWWNNNNSAEQKEQFVYDFYPPKKRNDLFPKLETIIRQAEVHYDAGDFELCKDILHLMWRTIDKGEENMKSELENKQNDPIVDLVNKSFSIKESVGEKPEFPNRDTNDSQTTE